MTEVACWLATAWTPLVSLPGATKLKVSATGAAGAFTVLSNMRPSSDSRRRRSVGRMGRTFLGAGRCAFVGNTLVVSVGLTQDLNQNHCGKTGTSR